MGRGHHDGWAGEWLPSRRVSFLLAGDPCRVGGLNSSLVVSFCSVSMKFPETGRCPQKRQSDHEKRYLTSFVESLWIHFFAVPFKEWCIDALSGSPELRGGPGSSRAQPCVAPTMESPLEGVPKRHL